MFLFSELYLQFVTHPILYKRINMRWNFGLPDALKPQRKFRSLLWLLILIDTVLTPILLPIIGYAFYRDQKKVFGNLRLLCTFRSIIFFKSGFLSQNIGRSVIFNFKKKLLKKTKFWRRNRSFTFTPEVKVYPLIDSPMMLCNQPRRLSRTGGYSVDQPTRQASSLV